MSKPESNILKFKILNKEYRIKCSDAMRSDLQNATMILNKQMQKFNSRNNITNQENLLLMAALDSINKLVKANTKVTQISHKIKLLIDENN